MHNDLLAFPYRTRSLNTCGQKPLIDERPHITRMSILKKSAAKRRSSNPYSGIQEAERTMCDASFKPFPFVEQMSLVPFYTLWIKGSSTIEQQIAL